MVLKGLVLLSGLVLALSVIAGFYLNSNSIKSANDISNWAEKNKLIVDKSKVKPVPFQVEYSEQEWQLLLKKLELTRYFEPLDKKLVPEFEFGFNPEYARELVDHWKSKFDWKSQVQLLNKYSQYKVTINDTLIHYVHVTVNPKKDVKPVPVLLLDGWPGSYYGFYKLLDYLSGNNQGQSLSIVIPSIPGYLFSTPLRKRVNTIDTAFLFDALMRLLHGEDCRYLTYGEDWGSIITTHIGQFFPTRVRGIHLTIPIGSDTADPISVIYSLVGPMFPSWFFTKEELDSGLYQRYSLASRVKVLLKDAGYLHLQATKPDTLGHGLTDSPVGLLAYIMEKYSSWTFDFNSEISGHRDGSLNKFNKDDLLTITTLYWMTNSITSSVRYYKCSFEDMFASVWPNNKIAGSPATTVPTNVQFFGRDIMFVPKRIIEMKYHNLTKHSITAEGGHFAAFQNPKLVGDDLLDFIKLC